MVLDFVKCLFCIYWDTHVPPLPRFPINSALIILILLNHPCILEIESVWSLSTVSFMYCWIQFASNLLRILASVFLRDICFQFSYNACLTLVLIYSPIKQVGNCFLFHLNMWWIGIFIFMSLSEAASLGIILWIVFVFN